MKRILPVFILIAAAFALPAFAQLDGNPENWCRNGLFPRDGENYSIARVTGVKGEKIYFYTDDENCPNGKNCRAKSYVIPNDELIVSRQYKGFACAWFQPKKGYETVGWIPLERLEILNLPRSQNEFTGDWYFYDNSIKIAKTGTEGVFKVTGDAFWRGLGDNVHTGELDHEGKIVGQSLKLGEDETEEYACKVSIDLVGNYLIVADNLNCGGANVTFSGVYRRSRIK